MMSSKPVFVHAGGRRGCRCSFNSSGLPRLLPCFTLWHLASPSLPQINSLADVTPRLASRARSTSEGSGELVTTRRNATTVVQVRGGKASAFMGEGP